MPAPIAPTPVETAAPESANAALLGSMVCTAPGCPNQGSHVALHADTIQPVHCGGCYAVLQCDHADQVTETVTEGTIGAPRERTSTTCRACKTVLADSVVDLPPINLLDLPASILSTPLG